MAEVELGAFIFMNIVAIGGIALTAKYGWYGVMSILSFVIFAGMALYSFGELVVVTNSQVTEANSGYNVTNSNGTIQLVQGPSTVTTNEKVIHFILDENMGYIYFVAAGFAILSLLDAILKIFRRRRMSVANQWDF